MTERKRASEREAARRRRGLAGAGEVDRPAGWLGGAAGLPATMALLGVLALLAALVAARLWPAEDPEVIPHAHPELPPDHPHLRAAAGPHRHAHPFVIDDLHHGWPVAGRA